MLLSICIPSYNRFGNLSRIISSIGKCDSLDFEVVIVDNCSPEDVGDIVPRDDSRFRLIKREKPVKGTLNCRQATNYGNGDFCMLLLDKDFLDGNLLDKFLQTLNEHSDVSCGVCALNFGGGNNSVVITEPSQNLKEMYLMRHPSGMFIKKCYVDEDLSETCVDDQESANGQELLLARGLIAGKFLQYNCPLVSTESEDEAAKTPSYSYTPSDVWFHPRKQTEAFDRYCKHLEKLNLPYKEKLEVVKRLYRRLVSACTVGYRDVMMNDKICQHYMIPTKDVTHSEMNQYRKEATEHFLLMSDIELSLADKKRIIHSETLYYYVVTLKSFLNKRKLRLKGN